MEQGTHHELIEKDGQYAALVRAQDLGSGGDRPDFSKEEADIEMERTITLQRTKTETKSVPAETELERLTAGTVGMGLWRCVYLMLMEQEGLTPWFCVGTVACLIGGGTYPAQALLFSRLINVFILPPGEAKSQADFFSLMFFIVAIANWIGYFALGWSCNVVWNPFRRGRPASRRGERKFLAGRCS
jgi:ATP-binding cassette subfamily B (MDR/TAP) protein 1